MSLTPPDRRLITFYSYKGGVGRTMAVANVAHRLAEKHGLKVIAVDWDLEAPGLHRFFGVPAERAASTNGVLDYFVAWRDAVERKAPEPPPDVRDVTRWLVPIDDEKHKPRFGSLSLLLAGRQDRTYDERLAGLHWQQFYAEAGGALAVERLREQLVANADVVLVDSRTGLTDAGGICTIQIPDGVVLMTAPNEQSLEGTESIARTIAEASTRDRAAREQVRVWLVVSRVSSIEETDLAARWFKDREAWFDETLGQGLWLKEDHPAGLRSHVIPHRGRWNFGEAVLREGDITDARDPLVVAYESITETLLRWLRGELPSASLIGELAAARGATGTENVGDLRRAAEDAEARGDTLGLAFVLRALAAALARNRREDEAILVLQQAIGIYQARGADGARTETLIDLCIQLSRKGRWSESAESAEKALNLARKGENHREEAWALLWLALTRTEQRDSTTARSLLQQAERIVQELPMRSRGLHLPFMASIVRRLGDTDLALQMLRSNLESARQQRDATVEKITIEVLLSIIDAGSAEATSLRARFAELDAAEPTPQ